jgi:hypothetical protein
MILSVLFLIDYYFQGAFITLQYLFSDLRLSFQKTIFDGDGKSKTKDKTKYQNYRKRTACFSILEYPVPVFARSAIRNMALPRWYKVLRKKRHRIARTYT